jgi:uncharacterized membrane protein YccC
MLGKPRCWPRIGGIMLGLTLGFVLAIELVYNYPSMLDYRMVMGMCLMVLCPLAATLMYPFRSKKKT